jgi:hypothetical protein
MTGLEFHLVEPPYFQLGEALHWIEFTQIEDAERDGWFSVLESIKRLEDALWRGDLQGYGSLDASPVQAIEKWTWTEFEILPAHSTGQIIQKRGQTDVTSFVVRSFKAYRSAALRDLSQPAIAFVTGIDGREAGFHRVLDQIIFLEDDLRRVFSTDAVSTKGPPPLEKKYPTFLREIEGGRYLYGHAPLSFDEVYDLLIDYLKRTRQLHAQPGSIRKGLERHYEEFAKLRQ